jgi:Flp pilus assembly protein TadG
MERNVAESVHQLMKGRQHPRERGAVIVLVALTLVMMLTMLAFSVDLGSARQAKAQVSSTTDSAALAGAAALAGRRNGSVDQGGSDLTQAFYDAASWAFKNLAVTMPSPTNCGTNKKCYNASDAKHTSVEITSPYTPTRLPSSWNAVSDPATFLHVKTCYDNPTSIAGVIGIRSLHVCSESTARGTGKFVANTAEEDDLNDSFARCATSDTVPLFDTAHWFPTATPAKDIPGKNNFGATYLNTVNLDPTSVVVTIASDNPFSIGDQGAATVHDFPESSAYVSVVSKAGAPNYKWEIKFTNYTTVDSHGVPNGAKNFKDTLPAGQYTFAVYAKTVGGLLCNQTLFTTTINAGGKNASSGPCQEDLFRGGTSPPNGAVVRPGDLLTATYYDETKPFVPQSTDSAQVKSHAMRMTLTGASGPVDITGSVTSPPGQPIFVLGAAHEYQWQQVYTYILPNDGSLASGQYTVEIQVYDSDQNKTGGDCGYSKWTINFAGADGQVQLWD